MNDQRNYHRGLLPAVMMVLLSFCSCVDRGNAGGKGRAEGGRDTGPPTSLLMISIDTWRSDYAGVSGSGKVSTPNIDRLAQNGVYDLEAVAACPLTTPSHATIFTGLLPSSHGVFDCTRYKLDDGFRTLAEMFRSAGYSTGAFVAGEPLKKRYGLDQGFDVYDDSGMKGWNVYDEFSSSRDGIAVLDSAFSYLNQLPDGKPAFMFVHFFDLHSPYAPHPEFDAAYPDDQYAAETAYVDYLVGRLAASVESERTREWRIVVAGDHGEGLGDHGEYAHGVALYSSTIHTPMIFYPKPEGWKDRAKPWGLVDLAPTVCGWMNIGKIEDAEGVDLFSDRQDGGLREFYSLTLFPSIMFGVNPCLGVRRGEYMYIRHGTEELYDMADDPGQTKNLALSKENGDVLKELRLLVDRQFPREELQRMLLPKASVTVNQSDLDKLRGLGYIDGPVPKLIDLQRADIRKVLERYDTIKRERETGFRTKDFSGLRREYEAFVREYPLSSSMWRNLGKTCLLARDERSAEVPFRKAILINPQDSDSMMNLAVLVLKQGKLADAEALLLQAIAIDGENATSRKNLGILYSDYMKNPEKALPHYKKFIELDTSDPDVENIKRYVQKVESLMPSKKQGGN